MGEQRFHVGIKALIRNNEGEVLTLRINPADFIQPIEGHWDLPGGRIEKGHSIEETLKKELREELGTDRVVIHELFDACIGNFPVVEKETGDRLGLLMVAYRCELEDPGQELVLNEEHLEYRWASPKEAAGLLRFKFPLSFCQKVNEA